MKSELPNSLMRGGSVTVALTVEEAARYLGVSESTLRRMIKARKIGHVRMGYRAVRLLVSDLNRWVEGHKHNAVAE